MKKNICVILMAVLRICAVSLFLAAFIPALNPARISANIGGSASLFTSAVSYQTIGVNFVRALNMGWILQETLSKLYGGAVICALAAAFLAAAFCLSLGNAGMRKLSVIIGTSGAIAGLSGMAFIYTSFEHLTATSVTERTQPMLPVGAAAFIILFILALTVSVAAFFLLPKPLKGEKFRMEPKYRLFLMVLPFLVLVALFSYLPLWGWVYSFFDYRPGFPLSVDSFAGLKWFNYLFSNPATRADIVRVLKNTFAMSGIGIATSWLPMLFAIFLCEIRFGFFKKGVQTLTTIPNFISWVLVYSVAFAIFSTEGFLNWMLINLGIIQEGTNYLMSGSHIWLKMWLWGTWKGLGWNAIIYIAGISSIDPQLYEAATVDGADRFQRMRHITVPGLLSTYFVLLLLSIANVLSNGMEQYLVFHNPNNRASIQVLDLYVYQLGLASATTNIPLATLIGMLKSVISVVLLFAANSASKILREETIV